MTTGSYNHYHSTIVFRFEAFEILKLEAYHPCPYLILALQIRALDVKINRLTPW